MTEDAQNVPLPNSRTSPVIQEEGSAVHIAEGGVEGEEGVVTANLTIEGGKNGVIDAASENEVEGLVQEEEDAGEDALEHTETIDVPAEAEDSAVDGEAPMEADEAGIDGEDDGTNEATDIPTTVVRPPSPSSRTSTPPLTSGAAPAAKSFRSVNVNKRFLSKTSSPSGTAPSVAKLGPGGRTATSPVPIGSTSSRLLSTKLNTIPSSKSSTSPGPSTPGSASSSPWAKPAAPPKEPSAPSTLQHPAPSRARLISSSNVAMGSGQGIGGSAPTRAWKTVSAAERRAQIGMARDFPTASEVAEGKKAAQLAAQAQAAHNQEILKGLSAFTQLGTEHRWDDEDDDDDVLDFGDGMVYPTHEQQMEQMMQPESILNQPVSKSERFVEDFDRSWPRRPPPPEVAPAPVALPQRPPPDADRVLFNASSNRLEAPQRRPSAQQAPAQPPKLLARGAEPPVAAPRTFDRPLPPHLQGESGSAAHVHPSREPAAPPRPAWGGPTQPPGHAQIRTSPQAQLSSLPPRRSFSQHSHPGQPPATPEAQAPGPSPLLVVPNLAAAVDTQTQEMHAAAEKARLRRLAEEQDREAAAERARKKAKELEERFGPAPAKPSSAAPETRPAAGAPPGLPAPAKQITIAQRPKSVPQAAPVPAAPVPPAAVSVLTPTKPGLASLPARPNATDGRPGDSWRTKQPESAAQKTAERSPAPAHVRPTAESFFERTPEPPEASRPLAIQPVLPAPAEPVVRLPGSPEKTAAKGTAFDSMLARIQAAMNEARTTPASPAPAPSASTPSAPPAALPSSPAPATTYFDVTQPEPPRSPLPAWRTYNVRVPRTSRSLAPVPKYRVLAFDSQIPTPAGWIMSFIPAIDQLNPRTLSRADLLVPYPQPRRFSRFPDPGPVVSISTRRFEPFPKKKRKAVYGPTTRASEVIQPTMASTSLLGTLSSIAPPAPSVDAGLSRQKSKSPVKTSLATKAEKKGAFSDGMGIHEGRARAPSDTRPGVRFMVSSELDGDSLLDEINKMSLETVEEGMDQRGEIGEGRVSGSETPKTPPSLSASSSRGQLASPNGTSTPWSKGPTQSTSHDHIKSMWEQAPGNTSTETARVEPSTAAPIPDPSTPLYPSLNAPSSADPPAARLQTNNGMKLPYSQSQTFSPPNNSYSTLRHSSSTGQFGLNPDQQNMIGLYARTPSNAAGNAVNGYGMQGGVWSSSAFGTGYGYAKPAASMSAMDQKAAMAFNSAQQGKDSLAYSGMGDQYQRYAQQFSPTGFPAHSPVHAQHQPDQTYGQSPYVSARGMTSPPQNAYTYAYGAPGSHLNAQGVRRDGEGYAGGGYYGGVNQTMYGVPYAGAGTTSTQGHGTVGQAGRVGAGPGAQRKMW